MNTLRRFFRLAAPFWLARCQWREWLLLSAVVGFALAIVQVSVLITAWNKTFYDALAALDGSAMPALVSEYLLYMALIVAFIACGNWLRKILLLRWREHLTRQMTGQWLSQHRHFRLQLTTEPDNPDQRIAEDIYLLSEKSIDLFKYFIMNAAKLIAFVAILWRLSGIHTFHVGGWTFTVHGYLVWIALAYSLLCTLATHLIGRRLQTLNVERQHREADYRATLLRIRDHSGQIAFYRGEAAEAQRLSQRFGRIKDNWRELIGREFKLESFSAAYLRLSLFIPILATLPMYLARSMTFGGMMEARSAFSNVQDGFGWFMDYYKRIIEWAAVVERLDGFRTTLEETALKEPAASSPDTQPAPSGQTGSTPDALLCEDLAVFTPQGRVLFQGLNFRLPPSAWCLLEGRSGIGKSTLLHTLAGLWPYYSGRCRLPACDSLFLPQRPYLPQATLRASLSYPRPPVADDEALRRVLAQVGLIRLQAGLDTEQEWQSVLSGGEQQRLSLARALLHRPALLFLDEATSQLDEPAALTLMALLKQELPHTLCLAVSHQRTVQDFFPQRLPLGNSAPAEQAACTEPAGRPFRSASETAAEACDFG